MLTLGGRLAERNEAVENVCRKYLRLKKRKDEQEALLKGSIETLQVLIPIKISINFLLPLRMLRTIYCRTLLRKQATKSRKEAPVCPCCPAKTRCWLERLAAATVWPTRILV